MEAERTPSGLEQALFGPWSGAEIDAWLGDVVEQGLGAAPVELLFRSGRIDAVYAYLLTDGRRAVVKVHRPPTDRSGLSATESALRHLHAGGFPCPQPWGEAAERDGHVVSFQSLLSDGAAADARRPDVRRAMVEGQARHIALLREVPGGLAALSADVAAGPAWTRHRDGPWPQPHDSVLDFSVLPDGAEWLEAYAAEASAELADLGEVTDRVVAHADWYAGNLRFAGTRLVAAFDWELFVEQEAVVAGLTAGGYLADDAPTPAEAGGYLDDYDRVVPLRGPARRAAVAAARWMLAYNARCDLASASSGVGPGSALDRLTRHRDEYRRLADRH